MYAGLSYITKRPVQVLHWLRQHAWLAFCLMRLCFFGLGICSLNLIMLLQANRTLFLDYGWQVAQEGVLRQLMELLLLSYVALVCWVGFKCCEKLLVDRLTRDSGSDSDAG